MQIIARAQDVGTGEDTREHVERRIGFALGRFADRIVRVLVTLRDLNGPRGGVDKLCRVAVQMRRLDPVTVTAEASGVHEAIDLAAERAKRAVSRRIDRRRHRRDGGAGRSSRGSAPS